MKTICKQVSILILLCFLSLFDNTLKAQEKSVIINGKLIDKATGEALIGGSIVDKKRKIGLITDSEGKFSIETQRGTLVLEFSYVGYKSFTKVIEANTNLSLSIDLEANAIELSAITVVGNKESPSEKVAALQMSVDKINMLEAKMLPAIFGEVDIIKILQLKPGVKSGGEGTAGFYVRGGGADQNLILVEKAPVYNPNHMLGFFSVFNADAVKEVELFKAAFPAQYAGRLSSVLDVKMNEGSHDKFTVKGGIGLVSSRLTLEAPFQKGKSSIIISGRRTYLDIFTDLLNEANKDNESWDNIPSYYFYDLNTKISVGISKKDQISLTAYLGNDSFVFKGDDFGARLLWGNQSATLEWDRQVNKNTTFSVAYFLSGYKYNINNQFGGNSFSLGSSIFDNGLSAELDYTSSKNHKIKVGLSGIYHNFSVGNFGLATDFSDIKIGQRLFGTELGVFASDEIQFSQKLKAYMGLHLSGFSSKSSFYTGLEPRLAANYKLTETTALKVSYARMYQYLHLVSNSSASLPTDLWYPSTKGVKPQFSDQIAFAYHQSLLKDRLFFSVEGYYKWLSNSVDFKDGASLFANPNLETEFVFGKGWTYGAEFYVEKRKGKTTGWIGYTLSWAWRKFDDINSGEPFRPRYDRRHDISLVVIHRINERLSISGTWTYGTGNYTSLATGRFSFADVNGQTDIAPEFLGRNDYQLPPAHRMDLSLVWKLRPKHGESDLTFSIYNLYSRRNPFFIYYEEEREGDNNEGAVVRITPRLVSLFPILPSITYNFKF